MLETKNIFIDTCIFIGQNYNYQSPIFRNLSRLVKTGLAEVYLTNIVVEEVRTNIKKYSEEKIREFDKHSRIFRIIRKAPYKDFFSEFDKCKSQVFDDLNSQFDHFIDDLNVTILPTSEVSIDVIFQQYFQKKPPFTNDKKKYEFPDAFTLEALKVWCKKNNEKMYVVSNDRDLKDACNTNQNPLLITTLAEFIDLAICEDSISLFLLNLLESNREDIKTLVSKLFCRQEILEGDERYIYC